MIAANNSYGMTTTINLVPEPILIEDEYGSRLLAQNSRYITCLEGDALI